LSEKVDIEKQIEILVDVYKILASRIKVIRGLENSYMILRGNYCALFEFFNSIEKRLDAIDAKLNINVPHDSQETQG